MALFSADDALRITATRLATHRFWVAQKDDAILGCVALDPHEGTVGEIRTFFIAPNHKRQGIGKRLWRAVVAIALTQGFSRLTICTDPNTLPFFEALGFTIQEMRESSCIKGRMTPVMFCDI
jgi:N-acetylglutamate synthase-like GNAT family acetyltransferase